MRGFSISYMQTQIIQFTQRGRVYLCLLLVWGFTFACGGSLKQMPEKPYHHVQGGFRNLPDSPERHSFSWDQIWFIASRPFMNLWWPTIPPEHVLPREEALRQFEALRGQDSLTWIGHLTAVLELNGQIILTDPWFSSYATPVPPFGPKRDVHPSLRVDDLPPVDVIVITHNHYDHLDLATLRQIPNQERITLIVPLGVGRYMKSLSYGSIVELDWHESRLLNGVRYTAVPSVHWSKRTLADTNETLWAGWIIDSGSQKVYVSEGEYGPLYREIGERYGPIHYALLSVGAYLPRGMMYGSHCIPQNCVQLGLDIQAEVMVPMHWGTVRLGTEGLLNAGPAFLEAARAQGVESRVWMMRIGETRRL